MGKWTERSWFDETENEDAYRGTVGAALREAVEAVSAAAPKGILIRPDIATMADPETGEYNPTRWYVINGSHRESKSFISLAEAIDWASGVTPETFWHTPMPPSSQQAAWVE